jgi:hypothetical protein
LVVVVVLLSFFFCFFFVGAVVGERRVTKGKGKKLRLEVKCSKPFDLSELSVWLIDEDGSSLQGFTLDTTKSKIEVRGCPLSFILSFIVC